MNKGTNVIKSALILPLVLIGSFMVTHLMAMFGVFLGIAYPIFTFFFDKKSVCFVCRGTTEGKICPWCDSYVEPGKYYPKSIKSVLLNTFVIFLLTALSVGIVFLENYILDSTGVIRNLKTVTFEIPAKGQYKINEVFSMKIEVKGIKTPINVVQADFSFDPKVLEVINVSTLNSFATIFLQKDVNNDFGYARISGGLPSPGFKEERGIFAEVYFKAKQAGLATVEFLPTSLVLANDGNGTSLLAAFAEASYIIVPESITPDQEISQREFLEKNVLGAVDPSDLGVCSIDAADETAGSGVLGLQDTEEIEENKFQAFIQILLDLWNKLNDFILSTYRNVFGF